MINIMQEYIDEVYELPSVDQFIRIERDEAVEATDAKTQQLLVDIFKDFNVEVTPSDIYRGPRKTRIEFYLARGKRVSACKGLEQDLALHARIPDLNVVAPVPGKATIAVDITRDSSDSLPIGNGLVLYDKYETDGRLMGFLGVNVEGQPVCVDFNDSPHLMLLGTTGSGKSVALQGLLMSLLMKYDPSQLSIFLASAYGATFPAFSRLPHLYAPIAHSVRRLEHNLESLKQEVERRLILFNNAVTANWSDYNCLIAEHKHMLSQVSDKLQEVCSSTNLEDRLDFLKTRIQDLLLLNKINKTEVVPLPRIVCFIDDVNYLMPVAESRMYEFLTYILRHGPTVGINVIMAAQKSIFTRNYPDLLVYIKNRAVFFATKDAECSRILGVPGVSALPACGVCLYQAKGKDVQEVQTCNVTHLDCVTMASHWGRYLRY